MAYVFHLLYVVTFVYIWGRVYTSRTFNIVSSFECVIFLVVAKQFLVHQTEQLLGSVMGGS
jgi:hypothetical protein